MSHDPQSERDCKRKTRDAILCALYDLGGQGTIAMVSARTRFGYGKISSAVSRSPAYFFGEYNASGNLTRLSLHKHLLTHMVA